MAFLVSSSSTCPSFEKKSNQSKIPSHVSKNKINHELKNNCPESSIDLKKVAIIILWQSMEKTIGFPSERNTCLILKKQIIQIKQLKKE